MSNLRQSVFWTAVLILSLPIGLLALLYLCRTLSAFGAREALTGVVFLLGAIAGIGTIVRVAIFRPFDPERLHRWMSRQDRDLAFILVVGSLVIASGAAVFAKNVSGPFGAPGAPWGARVVLLGLFVWAPLVGYRLKPLLDAYAAIANTREPNTDEAPAGGNSGERLVRSGRRSPYFLRQDPLEPFDHAGLHGPGRVE